MQRHPNQNNVIRLLKHGWNLVSASGFRISVAGILGIAGLVLALRRYDITLGQLSGLNWLSKSQDPSSLRLVPGLQNLGNNCFLNVILQAIEECEGSAEEDLVDSLPLAVALASLLEELCVVGKGRVVLSPRRVMLSIAHYIPSFNLIVQQDAAEAFLHLVASLREEFAGSCEPSHHSLPELCSSSCRIITPRTREDLNAQERWQQNFVGPFDGVLFFFFLKEFDGVLGSILPCQSCSSQISLNFEGFHSLPLSPVLDTGATIADLDKLWICTEQDLCDCRTTFCEDMFPWSNKFSYMMKQISIAHAPKILCIHLKRVSVNIFGQLVKLQGPVSFPIMLDLSSFMTSEVAIKAWDEIFQRWQAYECRQKPSLHTEISNIQYNTTRNLNYMYTATK